MTIERRRLIILAAVISVAVAGARIAAQQQPQPPAQPQTPPVGPMARILGQALFNQHCASCHQHAMTSENQTPIVIGGRSAPTTETLGQMTPEAIYATLTTGDMVQQGQSLTDTEKRVIAEFFGGRPLGAADAGDASHMTNHCASNPPINDSAPAGHVWNGWGNSLANTRFQRALDAGLSAHQVPRLQLKWAFGLPSGGETSGQPAIVGSRVFFGDYNSYAYSLDAATGCVYWSFHADGQIRTAALVAPVRREGRATFAVFFGDKKANVYALDPRTGALLWKRNLEQRLLSHITGAPAYYKGRLYVGLAGSEEIVSSDPHYPCCTYRGSLTALDASTGDVIWKTHTIPDEPKPTKKNSIGTQLWAPAGASIWTTPTIDPKRNAIYVGTGNAFTEPAVKTSDSIMAFDLKTGKVLWSYQALANDASPGGCGPNAPRDAQCPQNPGPDWDFGNSPILRTLKSGKRVLVAAHKGGQVVAVDPDRGGKLLWTADLSAGRDTSAPVQVQIMWGGAADAEIVYYDTRAGSVAAIRLADGKIVWNRTIEPSPAHPGAGGRPRKGVEAALTLIPGVLFAGGWDGVLHALSTDDGHELWQFDTAREFTAANGVPAHGGSLGAPGPVIAGGMLFVGSGYVGTGNGMPGNVLLAFSAQ
ncbi:MAG TPA: PQQ-binding-like beta-propeller repeat protein [Candidatus Acidoferrum sp.]|nr:PQQ-binding-like beta-propeller repeat protein [Candidatus Acidoferrum sp.]